ncbi:hypothetical protein [Actinosynnema sp. NPDC020468]|uniref:hypothetical protein n=1 Tax=Actinosynnema sp. NPDC020468 TaxID=3154488 RepID=UPI0033C15872
MRLLLWIALLSALAVVGALTLPLLAGFALVVCSDSHRSARRRGPRTTRPARRSPVEPTPA